MCLPMEQKSFLALLTWEASIYSPQKYAGTTTLKEVLWRSPIQPYGNCHCRNTGVTGLKSNGHNWRSIHTTGRKMTVKKYQSSTIRISFSYLDIHCLLGHAVEVQRPVAAHLAVQSQKFHHLNIPCYSSHYREHTPARVLVCPDNPSKHPALPKDPQTNAKVLIPF